MSDDATPRLGLPYLAAAQAQKHVTLNQSLSLLDGLVQTAVESRTVAAEPTSPADGALYILPAGATGTDWSGQSAGTPMRFEAGAWSALDLRSGWIAYLKDENVLLCCTGAGWIDVGLLIRVLGAPGYAKAALPSPAMSGLVAFVPDESGGATLAFSDGTHWRRTADRAVVS